MENYERLMLLEAELVSEGFKCVGVYAPNISSDRRTVCDEMRRRKRDAVDPWIIMEDFNELLVAEER